MKLTEGKKKGGMGSTRYSDPLESKSLESKCEGIFGKIFGHSYSPVYDSIITPTSPEKVKKFTDGIFLFASDVKGVVDSFTKKEKIYRVHVCGRCGELVRRE